MKVMKRATKLKCVLLDADIIIKAYEQEIWETMLKVLDVKVPSTVVNEAFFFENKDGFVEYSIDLKRLAEEGAIEILEASIDDIIRLQKQFDGSFCLDAGEEEAIAILFADKAEGAIFCSADKLAIQALAMLDLVEQGSSLEKILKINGINKKLYFECTDEHFQKNIKNGKERFITRQGLANKKIF